MAFCSQRTALGWQRGKGRGAQGVSNAVAVRLPLAWLCWSGDCVGCGPSSFVPGWLVAGLLAWALLEVAALLLAPATLALEPAGPA